MSNIATTIEQSKHLLELGLPKETADMSYSEEYFGKDKDGNDEWCWKLNACKFVDVEGIIPAWSLSALLEVMPKDLGIFHKLTMDYLNTFSYTGWRIGYSNEHWSFKKMAISQNLIDAAYECICQMYEENLVENDENDV